MRSILVASLFLLTAACASSPETQPAPVAAVAPAPVAAAAPAVAAPQCYNGDLGNFQAVGTVASVSGVKVQCKLTSDGKGASWNTAK
ncbi:hypothetical protein [Uliginosibacterium aquaticum]|uniref:Uncharacterized protein n=1 Tax=Uliginosibacterium aquaticum TaxID=2731212 RepID=A0ABX2IPZ5_9RHOO|nr:hypothetical protein [Uliginosibacterium aquaticum]NSL56769.1 hypothetical protein [Uliginosibacterium aquaticum]